jgi:hypothetical protein
MTRLSPNVEFPSFNVRNTEEPEKSISYPLEAYEIDFSGSSVALKLKEGNSTLGHRRVILPAESTFGLVIQHSVVDMALDGVTHCELRWDFQGSSPILQVAPLGQSPSSSSHEEREQIALLISSLRQGRFNMSVSSVGGLKITEAKTSRENGDGLYDWKFFNALVSPDGDSPSHLYKVIHDKRTMSKLLQIMKLINADIEKIASYILQQGMKFVNLFYFSILHDHGQCHSFPKFGGLRIYLIKRECRTPERLFRAIKWHGLYRYFFVAIQVKSIIFCP